MSLAPILIQDRANFYLSAWVSIIFGMQLAWNRSRPPHEPDIVASLVLQAMPMAANAWSKLLRPHGIDLSVAAVYCHQTPKVHYQHMSGNSCELGDLLVVHVHTDSTGTVARNAVLFQAKMSSRQPYHVAQREMDQLHLYTDWPAFEYVTSGNVLNGQRRDLRPKSSHSGAQYLLIDDRSPSHGASGLAGVPGTYPIGVCMPGQVLADHDELAEELVRFLGQQTGRVFDDRSQASQDTWTAIVWDLLNVGLTKAFNRKRAGYRGAPRIAGHSLDEFDDGASVAFSTSVVSLTTASEILGGQRVHQVYEIANNDNEPPRRYTAKGEEFGDDDGISILLLETTASGEPTERRERPRDLAG